MVQFCWLATVVAALVGIGFTCNAFLASSAVQQAAGAAIACAVVIPLYCIARAFQAREDAVKIDNILRLATEMVSR